MYSLSFCRNPKPRALAVVIVGGSLLALSAMWSKGFAQSSSQPSEEWDAVEVGLVELLARGNPSLRQPPAVQIVSPPIDLDYKDAESVRRVLVETADTIPQWGPYFRPSGRSLRKEFQTFLSALETPPPAASTRPGAADARPFQFSPDFSEMAAKGSPFLEPEKIRWEVRANSDSKTGRTSSTRIRLRIGPLSVRGSSSGNQSDINGQTAEGVFSASGMSTVSVIPGGWFSNRLIATFAKGPFKPGKGAEYWWGPTGQLGLYPRSLVIMSDPTFSLRVDAASYHKMRAAFSGGASIGVGPFLLRPESDGMEVSFDQNQLTVTARKRSRAMIVAILNQVNKLP